MARIRVMADGAIDQDHRLQVSLLVIRVPHTHTAERASMTSVVDASPQFAQRRLAVERPDLPPLVLKMILDKFFGPSV